MRSARKPPKHAGMLLQGMAIVVPESPARYTAQSGSIVCSGSGTLTAEMESDWVFTVSRKDTVCCSFRDSQRRAVLSLVLALGPWR